MRLGPKFMLKIILIFKMPDSKFYRMRHLLLPFLLDTTSLVTRDLELHHGLTLKKLLFRKKYIDELVDVIEYLTHFSPVSHFYTPFKRQKSFGFLTFSGGMEI